MLHEKSGLDLELTYPWKIIFIFIHPSDFYGNFIMIYVFMMVLYSDSSYAMAPHIIFMRLKKNASDLRTWFSWPEFRGKVCSMEVMCNLIFWNINLDYVNRKGKDTSVTECCWARCWRAPDTSGWDRKSCPHRVHSQRRLFSGSLKRQENTFT